MRKNRRRIAIVLLVTVLLLSTGCSSGESPLPDGLKRGDMVLYSNLTSGQEETGQWMSEAGISDERIEIFFAHVNQFNEVMPAEWLTEYVEEKQILDTKYDPYEMQDVWMEAYPDFLGYNCRITAFSLLSDFIEADLDGEVRNHMILMDLAALEEDGSAMALEDDLKKFKSLYSTVPTDSTADVAVHVENLKKDWLDRGIRFDETAEASLIAVLFQEEGDNGDYLFVGHAGVLLQDKETERLCFVEKIAFQEPYQVSWFETRTQLNDYLMTKYDVSEGQPTAPPFIMENGDLMEGYRQVPETWEEE